MNKNIIAQGLHAKVVLACLKNTNLKSFCMRDLFQCTFQSGTHLCYDDGGDAVISQLGEDDIDIHDIEEDDDIIKIISELK